MTNQQHKQIEIIDQIEKQINSNSLKFSVVSPVKDYENDPRVCLTSVHLPHKNLLSQIQQTLIEPLQKIVPNFYYYPIDSLHMTIKSVRVINNPPHFSENDIQKAIEVFSKIIPKYQQFQVYFHKLLLFPNNLSLILTTDPELDKIILDLDKTLKEAGIPDDKQYTNSQYFFTNMTLARFNTPPSIEFKQKVKTLSDSLRFKPYIINSVTLLTCNGVLKNRQIKGNWNLNKAI